MIFEHQSKNKVILLIISFIILIVGISVLLYSPVIFQEGNPWPQIKGMTQLDFTDKDMVKLSSEENRYMTKSKNGVEVIKEYMKYKGYDFTEQMGSGYFFQNDIGDRLIVTHKFYSRFYSIWTISEINKIRDSIEWIDYKNEEYDFIMRYPKVSISNYFWGASLPEGLSMLDLLLPNQVLNKNNNFYLTQKYNLEVDRQKGELIKTENTFIPEYIENDHSYPLSWYIVIFDVKNEADLDSIIKDKMGSGCSYKSKIATSFENNYRVEINGDGKDLGSTNCPVNYANYIIYSPLVKKVAFWSLGQECNIGLGFMSDNCFDWEISNSFHFYDIAKELENCLPKSDMASHEKCNELLATIRNFNDCVNAGFSIMKSNPSQCTTPDGRNFTDESNGDWNMALTALNNCEVKSVFQTHSKRVTLELKNGAELIVYEPKIDEVMRVVDSLEDKCGRIRMATE